MLLRITSYTSEVLWNSYSYAVIIQKRDYYCLGEIGIFCGGGSIWKW